MTAQVAGSAVLGIMAQVFLVWVIVGYVMPFFGLELLGMVAHDDKGGLTPPSGLVANSSR